MAYTTYKEILECPHGLYRIFWHSGGSSVAAVGSLYDGTRWVAPTNWTSLDNPASTLEKCIKDIKSMEFLLGQMEQK